MPLPLSALAGSPFETYLGPGLILFTILGIGPLVAARLAWRRSPLAPIAAFVVGIALLIWVAVEITIIGYSNEPPLQAISISPNAWYGRRWFSVRFSLGAWRVLRWPSSQMTSAGSRSIALVSTAKSPEP